MCLMFFFLICLLLLLMLMLVENSQRGLFISQGCTTFKLEPIYVGLK